MFNLFKHKNSKEKYLIDFELIYVNDTKGSMYISISDFQRFILDYALNNNITIKNLSVNRPEMKSYVEVSTKSDYAIFLNFFLEPCNSKWTKVINH